MSNRNRDAAAVRFPPPFLYLISIGLGVLAHRFARPWPLPGLEGLTRAALGLAVVAAGVGLAVVAIGLFKHSGQEPEPWKSTPSILTGGIYRYSRNPMYVAVAIVQIGVGLGLGNLWIVAFTALSLTAVYVVAIRHEEAYLDAKFGDEYRRYKARVRRWI